MASDIRATETSHAINVRCCAERDLAHRSAFRGFAEESCAINKVIDHLQGARNPQGDNEAASGAPFGVGKWQ